MRTEGSRYYACWSVAIEWVHRLEPVLTAIEEWVAPNENWTRHRSRVVHMVHTVAVRSRLSHVRRCHDTALR